MSDLKVFIRSGHWLTLLASWLHVLDRQQVQPEHLPGDAISACLPSGS